MTKPIAHATVAIVDTETTGLEYDDQAVSIGVILVAIELPKGTLLREVDSYYSLREPTCAIHPRALAVHGLTPQLLAGHTIDWDKVGGMLDCAHYVIAHNAKFDSRMIGQFIANVHRKKWLCSYRQVFSVSLDRVCSRFGIVRPNPHNALDDCRALLQCLLQHTGKTNRSRTHIGVLLGREPYYFDTYVPLDEGEARRREQEDREAASLSRALRYSAEIEDAARAKKREERVTAIIGGILLFLIGIILTINSKR